MNKSPLVIINNEKIFKEDSDFYCDNLDLKVLPEGLGSYHQVRYIVRSSNKKGDQKINLKDIDVAPNIFKFIYFILKTFKISNTNYLLISITPYTLFSFLVLFLFRKKTFLYLMSSGHEEYKYILGNWTVWIYHIMYKIVTSGSTVIVCHERLYDKKKSHLVFPSRLDKEWFDNHKEALLDKIRFLYIGRMSFEKGIYTFLELFNKIKLDAELSIVGEKKNSKTTNKNIKFLGYISNPKSLIDIYDNNNITILPSFTEAHPYVVDESLARKRPVIIFDDIAYIVRDKKGVFVSKRDMVSFLETAKYIVQNYHEIQKNIEKNTLPTKKDMLKHISDIVNYKNS